jgi:enoyl-[acyl-carrier-protein] reductase (NADH)
LLAGPARLAVRTIIAVIANIIAVITITRPLRPVATLCGRLGIRWRAVAAVAIATLTGSALGSARASQ